jgi:hypothetical protein
LSEGLKSFEGKVAKILYRDGEEVHSVVGLIVCFNSSFLVERSSKNQSFFLRTSDVLKIEEIVSQDDTEARKVTKP